MLQGLKNYTLNMKCFKTANSLQKNYNIINKFFRSMYRTFNIYDIIIIIIIDKVINI